MIPRKKLDIGWRDLAFGLKACFANPDDAAAQASVENLWSPAGNALALFSVRSGFDLVLQQLALPQGSEILVSAITIGDMVGIIEHHGLVAVPVDLDPATCAVRPNVLDAAVTTNTRAIVIAHLFGSRMEMDGIVAFAQRHKLFLFEDCAQAFAADGYRGHPDTDVAMFSFGTIKTATAGGGALFSFLDGTLRAAIAERQRNYAVQPASQFAKKLLKIASLKALSYRLPYTLFVGLCRFCGNSHDRIISKAVRGFAGGDLMPKLRQQPPSALLALLARRLRNCTPAQLAPRIAAANTLLQQLPAPYRLGTEAGHHTHWVLPTQCAAPDALVAHLWRQGFDATRGASSMIAVPAPAGRAAAVEAQRMMGRIVYLPFDTCGLEEELGRLANAIGRFDEACGTMNSDFAD